MTMLLIDGDLFLYRTCAALEHEVRWDDGIHTLHCNEEEIKESMELQMNNLLKNLEAKKAVLCFSSLEGNYRKKVLSTYKENRKEQRKPLGFMDVRAWCFENPRWTAIEFPMVEADDLMGILGTKPQNQYKAIVVSDDKDMQSLPVRLARTNSETEELEVRDISLEEADEFFYAQALAGDSTDGYAGCPGWGIGKALEAVKNKTRLIPYEHELKSGPRKGQVETRYKEEPTESLWDVVKSRYEAAGLNEEVALQQARVARILRWSDWNYNKKEVKLWTPPEPTPHEA